MAISKIRADKKIQIIIDFTIKMINSSVENVISILLVGGLGRGDLCFKHVSGSNSVIGDIDLYIVVETKLKKHHIKAIKDSIKNQIAATSSSNCKWMLDLHFISLGELKLCPSTLRFYDLKHASKVIYGKEIRNRIPDFNLPLYEGTRLLLNRMRYSMEWLSIGTSARIPSHKWISETAKNYYICCQALTILAREYEPFPEKAIAKSAGIIRHKFPQINEIVPGLQQKSKMFFSARKGVKINVKYPAGAWLASLASLLLLTKFYHQEYIRLYDWNLFDKKISYFYARPYLFEAIKTRFGFYPGNWMLSFLVFCLNRIQIFKWFFKIAAKKHKIYLKALILTTDPVLSMYESTLFAMSGLQKGFKIDKIKFEKAVRSLKKVYPLPVLPCNAEGYNALFAASTELYDLYFGIGQTFKGKFFDARFTVIS